MSHLVVVVVVAALSGQPSNICTEMQNEIVLSEVNCQIDEISKNILDILEENGNFIPVTDKSNPKIIYDIFSISKKSFKKAIGNLYKNRLISIEDDGIRFNE